MAKLSKKVAARISAGLRKFQPVLKAARSRDVNESDTSLIITDVLHDICGYEKYADISSEHMIRGTYCDLAVSLDGHLALLIEVKAIGISLKEQHVKQAVDYAANQGVDWVALTNGIKWQVYRVKFSKPIQHELVVDLDLLELNPRTATDLELIGLLAKEGWRKARLGEYHSQRQALNRFVLGSLVISDPVVNLLRREIRRVSPNVRVSTDEIREALREDVLKREVLEGEDADTAKKRLSKATGKRLRRTRSTVGKNSSTAGAGPDLETGAAPKS